MKDKIQASFFELAFFTSMGKESIEREIRYVSSREDYLFVDTNEYVLKEIFRLITKTIQFDQFTNNHQTDYINLVKKSLLNYIIDEEFYTILIEEDEWKKFKSLVKRNDFKSRLVVEVLNKCRYLIVMNQPYSINAFSKLFEREIKREIKELENKLLANDLGNFKKKIDSITGGLCIECYKEFINVSIFKPTDCYIEINNYILEKYKYNLVENNPHDCNYIFEKSTNKLTEICLSLLLYNDNEFWRWDCYPFQHKSLYAFINIILKYHPFSYVEKIIDYLFNELRKNENYNFIIEKKLPIYAIDKERFLSVIKKRVVECIFGRFKLEFSNETMEQFQKMLIFPLYDVKNEIIEEGKKLFEAYIEHIYETNSKDILNIFSNASTVVQVDNTKNGKSGLTVESYFSFPIYGDIMTIKKSIEAYSKGFFSNQNVLARIYIEVYLCKTIFKENYINALNEIFYDFFDMLEKEKGLVLGIKTDQTVKENHFKKLKEILKAYDVEIGLKEGTKENYIISLLDRKVATIRQQEKFPELEQLGDAIYNFVVSEALFYNSKINSQKEFNEKFQEYVCGKSQVKIANVLGLDKLYINLMNINDNSEKLTYVEKMQTNTLDERRYNEINISLADTLEMIVGSVSIEYGYMEAIKLCKKLIATTYPKLIFEKISLFDVQNDKNFSLEYKKKIFPGPFEIDFRDNDYCQMWRSIEKFLMIQCYGNDTKEKRNWIAHSTFPDTIYCFKINGEIVDIRNQMLYAYLYNDIQTVIEMYTKRLYTFPVINLHFIDKCNFHCYHCFINKKNQYELTLEQIQFIVDKIDEYFKSFNIKNGRINLAGGEPLVSKNIQAIIDYIHNKEIEVSIVTNGMGLTNAFIEENKEKVKTIGISLDSIDENTNISIGRCTNDKKVCNMQELIQKCKKIKEVGIVLKINTCVSKLNINEDFTKIYTEINPDKLKLFQMTIIDDINSNQKDKCISLDEFNRFCDKYKSFQPICENSDSMLDSYVIVDSRGNLSINNAHKENATFNIFKHNIVDMIEKLDVSSERFNERYLRGIVK